MKDGPCGLCIIGPICSDLCEEKIDFVVRQAALEENKAYQDVTLGNFIKQLQTEGLRIRSIRVVDPENASNVFDHIGAKKEKIKELEVFNDESL